MLKAAMDFRREKKALRKRMRALYWNRWRNTLLFADKKRWWEQ